MRNKTKKLEGITKLEGKNKASGNLTRDEIEKLQAKDALQLSIDETINMFQLYKKQIAAKESAQAAGQVSTEVQDAQPVAAIATRE